MKTLDFSLKRALTAPILLLYLLLLLLTPLAYSFGKELDPLPFGCCVVGEADSSALRLQTLLTETGFTVAASEEALREQVAARTLDAGILIPGGLRELLENDELSAVLGLITAPASLQPDLAQEQAAAALFTLYAPYITANSLSAAGIPEAEVLKAFDARLKEGDLFRLELSREDGLYLPRRERSLGFYLGSLSLLLFTGLHFAVLEPLRRELRLLRSRLPYPAAFGKCFLPGLLVRTLLLYLAVLPGVLLLRETALLLPLAGFLLSLLVLGLLFTALPGRDWQTVTVLLLAGLSLPLCPIYTDFALAYPEIARIRPFLPTYWLWLLREHPLWGLPALPAPVLTPILLYGLGKRQKGKTR